MHFLLSPFTCMILFCFWSQIGLFPAECCDCVHHTHAHMLTHTIFLYIRLSIYIGFYKCIRQFDWTVNSTDAANSFEAKEQRSSLADIVPLEAELQREQKPARYNIKNECGSFKFDFIYEKRQQARLDPQVQFSDVDSCRLLCSWLVKIPSNN